MFVNYTLQMYILLSSIEDRIRNHMYLQILIRLFFPFLQIRFGDYDIRVCIYVACETIIHQFLIAFFNNEEKVNRKEILYVSWQRMFTS